MTDKPANPDFIYITTIGRKTGNPHTVEIWFMEHESAYYVCSGQRENADFVKNILNNPAVTFGFGGWTASHVPGMGRVVSEPELTQILTQKYDQKYNWSDGLFVEIKP